MGVLGNEFGTVEPRTKVYLDNFTQEKEDDLLGCFEVGRDKDGNPKYGPVTLSFLDIEDDMESALAMESYFNPFKNIIIFKKLIDFLGLLLVQLKNTDRGNKGYVTYKKVEGGEAWHAKFEVTTPRMYEEDKLNHGLFGIQFTKLEVDDKLFNHEAFWQKIRKEAITNPRTSLIKEPLMRIMHKLFVRSLVHRAGSKERCQKRDMWMMSTLEESRGINLAWVIVEHLCKHALSLKENSLICGGHYVTKISHSLGYLNKDEVAKCSKPIEYETWTVKMLANELDEGTHTLMKTKQDALQPGQARRKRQEPRGLDSSWGDWNASLNKIERSIVPSSGYEIGGSSARFHGEDFGPIVHSKDYVESDDDEMRD
uniref:Uncharacterized protein n=1 Tax=Tanacetum cinerariifolium TaxID=118510 RepID=A0A6L2NW78_TANCI|nr:hypothetical protein [Tanacetum cinerariifolium]